ncbi:hypothetical protein FBUS_09873 [Fasciolopsis buskii]|uniref:Uncharacterized protein n=1 Tax=Fasciolopsis buskii TaxID=27845 RepID=A0A8E0RU14_9TREM|nr:hypothetical protein FBUS_09873 [Fasciolopsis buski]
MPSTEYDPATIKYKWNEISIQKMLLGREIARILSKPQYHGLVPPIIKESQSKVSLITDVQTKANSPIGFIGPDHVNWESLTSILLPYQWQKNTCFVANLMVRHGEKLPLGHNNLNFFSSRLLSD